MIKPRVRKIHDAVEESSHSLADGSNRNQYAKIYTPSVRGKKVRITADAVEKIETSISSLLETIIEEESIDSSDLKVGSRVLVDYKGTLYNATVRKCREKLGIHEVLIHYDGQKNTTVYWVSVDRITYILPQSNLDKPKRKKRKRPTMKRYSIVRGVSPINTVSSIIDRDVTTDSIRRRTAPKRFVARPSKSGVGVEDGDKDYLTATNTSKLPINKKRVGNSVGQCKVKKPSSTATIVSLDNDEVPLEYVSIVKKGKGGKPLCKAKGCQKYKQGRHGLCATHYKASSEYQLKKKSMIKRYDEMRNERHSIRKRSAPELFEAQPAKYRAVKDGKSPPNDQLPKVVERTRSLQSVHGSPAVLLAEMEEASWRCHLCNNSNDPSKSRCSSCLGWRGGSHFKKWYIASADETPRGVANKLQLNLSLLIRANKTLHPTLLENSKLKKGTYIQISHFPNVKVIRVKVTQGGLPISAPSKPDNTLEGESTIQSEKVSDNKQKQPQVDIQHDESEKKRSGQKYMIGTPVMKYFYSRPYWGEVASYCHDTGLYFIKYEDDDAEEVEENELNDIAMDPRSRKRRARARRQKERKMKAKAAGIDKNLTGKKRKEVTRGLVDDNTARTIDDNWATFKPRQLVWARDGAELHPALLLSANRSKNGNAVIEWASTQDVVNVPKSRISFTLTSRRGGRIRKNTPPTSHAPKDTKKNSHVMSRQHIKSEPVAIKREDNAYDEDTDKEEEAEEEMYKWIRVKEEDRDDEGNYEKDTDDEEQHFFMPMPTSNSNISRERDSELPKTSKSNTGLAKGVPQKNTALTKSKGNVKRRQLVWARDSNQHGAALHPAYLIREDRGRYGNAEIEWASTHRIATVPKANITRELQSRSRRG